MTNIYGGLAALSLPLPMDRMALLCFAGAALLLLTRWLTGANRRKHLFERQTSVESIRTLTWLEFEQLIGEYFRRQGYIIEESGGAGADGGVDLRLFRRGKVSLVQCKHWKVHNVGVKPVRELYGVMVSENADNAIFVTSGLFSADAKAFAHGKPLELMDGQWLSRVLSLRDRKTIPPAMAVKPCCPLCDRAMIPRYAKQGANAGTRFWGCPAYPSCTGTRPADEHI